MVRPECYRCARCKQPWPNFYPRTVCRCGCDVLVRVAPDPDAPAIELARPFDLRVVAWQWLGSDMHWSPYPVGNGTEGAHA